MRMTFRFKAKLSPSAIRNAERQLNLCRELYNACVKHRKDAWSRSRVSIRRYAQQRELKDIRVIRPEFSKVDAQVLANVTERVERAFEGFFRRIETGGAPGYPRFKSRDRYNSFTYRQNSWALDGKRLTLRGVGTLKLFLSRPIEGRIKTVTLKRDRCGDWFVCFSCDDAPARPLPDTGKSVGVDLGLSHFVTTSEGEHVANLRPFVATEVRLARAQRRRSKMKRGGMRSAKQRVRVAKLYRKTARVRRDFHFKTAVGLVRRYDFIAVEDLNVLGLSRMRLAKSVKDAGWGQFLEILRFKAESAGRVVIAVDPRGTSQVCSGCGCEPEQRKTLAVRTHICADCGLVLDRDHNAARNILTKARAGPTASRPASKAAA